MSDEKNERSISEDTAENIRSGGTALSSVSTLLEILNKCGAVCKRIPFGNDIVDSVLFYDETKSIRKALVKFGVNTIGGIVDKPLVVVFIFDVELGIWTYNVIDDAKSSAEDKINSSIDSLKTFFNDMFNAIDNGSRNLQNRFIFKQTGILFGAYLEVDRLTKDRFVDGTNQTQRQYLS